MGKYFLKRLLSTVPTLLGITVICFAFIQFVPGGPIESLIARGAGGAESGGGFHTVQITAEQRQNLIHYYGFDRPLPIRYWEWLTKIVRLDFGDSYYYSLPVKGIISAALPVSLTLGVLSFFLTYLFCIPLGILKAVKRGTLFDRLSSFAVYVLYSFPTFALGLLLIVLFSGGSFWRIFPIEGFVSDGFSDFSFFQKVADLLWHLTLPLICYTVGSFATVTLLMKNSLLKELHENYVTTARAKGLGEWNVILRHAVRNAFLPIANGMGQWIATFFTGSLLIETVFNIRGLGRLSYDSVLHRDYPIILTVILLLSFCRIIGNLFSDVLYVVLDPRIDFK